MASHRLVMRPGVEAFDRFFRAGFGGAKLNRETLTKISDFYTANKSTLDAVHIPTLDFLTENDTPAATRKRRSLT
jgi:hypothetical protein